MAHPSEYELAAWRELQSFEARPLTRLTRAIGDELSQRISTISKASSNFVNHPKAPPIVGKGRDSVAGAAKAIGRGAKNTVGAIPDSITDWSGPSFSSMRSSISRVSRIALSPERIVKKHRKRGHSVDELADLRKLDLQQIDKVRGREASLSYPALAALSGVSAGIFITGGEISVTVSAGAAAAPSGALVAGSMVIDAAVVLSLASHSVGRVALDYGYDPEDPTEKLFVMSIVNVGTALSASAKTAAMADISRLTQALVRGKVWSVLDKSVLTQVSKQFAKAFGLRFTKQSLGKVIPVAGALIGGTFNWATLEELVDAANIAYRYRFLLEKYPSLQSEDISISYALRESRGDEDDEVISIIDAVSEAGGPDLGSEPLN